MSEKTVTEALAQIKTVSKRLEKKRQFVLLHLTRESKFRDPLSGEDGGSQGVLERERQAISDLEEEIVRLRSAINRSNQENSLTVGGKTRTIADWLVWKREVLPSYHKFIMGMNSVINSARNEMSYRQRSTAAVEDDTNDLIVNMNEKELGVEAERLEEILGNLDGQLSLANATITINI